MKDLISFIKESINDINKYYVNIDDLKNGQKYWVGVYRGDNNESEPMELMLKKEGKEFVFSNPDDDREMFDLHSVISSMSDDNETLQIAIFDNENVAKKFCEYYNTNKR